MLSGTAAGVKAGMLHAPTAYLLSVALATTCGIILLILWLQDRRHVAMASWGAAHLLGAIALVLVAARGTAPLFVSIDLANAMLAVTYGLIWAGAQQFRGGQVPLLPLLAGAAIWLAACRIPAFYEDISARVLLMGLISAAYYAAAAWAFRPRHGERILRSQRLILGILSASATCYLMRLPVTFLGGIGTSPIGHPTSPVLDLLLVLGVALAGSTALGLVALCREKEEREAHAALLAARDAADQASAGKTRFLAHLSHELRTPLNGVLGLAQALRHDPALPEAQRERVAMLDHAGRHLNALLNDVLDLSSIEAGRLELVPIPTRLRPLIEEVSGLARAGAEAKGVALLVTWCAAVPEAVLCDPLRVRQILHNLLNNAVKFTPPGGEIVLALHRPDAAGLSLTVTDDGPGVPEEVRDRLFQDYSRATREAARGDGTGLGLAISARLAQAMGGTIRFGVPPHGRGSLFEVALPLPEAAPPALPEVAAMPVTAIGLRVLVVDDLAVNRFVLRAMLEQAGHAVAEAEDGQAALDALAGTDPLPDLVLMDAMMPRLDGLEATRRIRALPGPAARLRILAVTAAAMPDQKAECLAAGMDGHLAKPVDRRTLLAAIDARKQAA